MKSNKTIGIISVSILLIGGYFIYQTKFWKKDLSFSESIELIVKTGKTGTKDWLEKADIGYVKNWAKAILKKEKTFEFNGQNYNVVGGRAIKN